MCAAGPAPPATYSDENEGYDDDGYPAGLLMFGQAGVYNAVDDRMLATALGDGVTGIVKRATVTPGAGLNINLSAGWLGVASCDDGTVAVVGARQSYTLGPAQGILAGPGSGAARADLLWCDTYPDEGRWRLSVIREYESAGRPGLPLARITCPPGTNLASQFTYANMVPTFGSHADSLMLGTSSGTGVVTITPNYPIAPWMIRPRSHFRLKAYGWGRWGASVRHVMFRVGHASTPYVWLNFAGLGWPAGAQFSWNAEANIQCRMNRQNIMISIWATCGLRQGTSFDRGPNAISNIRQTNLTSWNPDAWNSLQLQGRFDANAAGQLLECTSATFETIEPWDIY